MTPKQQRFVEEYLIDLNATKAAIRAGYAKARASEQGYQLLHKTTVQQAIHEAQTLRAERTGLDQDWVLARLRQNAERSLEIGKPTYNATAANRSLELIGKHLGMFVDRSEVGQPGDFTNLDREQLDAEIRATAEILGIDVGMVAANGTGKPGSIH